MIFNLFHFAQTLIVPNHILIGVPLQISFEIDTYTGDYLKAFSLNTTRSFVVMVNPIDLVKSQELDPIYYIYYLVINTGRPTVVGYHALFQNQYFYANQSNPIPYITTPTNARGLQLRIPLAQSSIYKLTIFVSNEIGARFFNKSSSWSFERLVPTYLSVSNQPNIMPNNYKIKMNDKYSYGIFYQIINYQNKPLIYMGLYVKRNSNEPIRTFGWIGVIFGSRSITDNDCILTFYRSMTGNALGLGVSQDSVIFGGGWPYADSDELVKGTQDVNYVSSVTSKFNIQRKQGSQKGVELYYISFLRYFETNDTIGDIVIEEKSNYKVCMAFNMLSRNKEEIVDCFFIQTNFAAYLIPFIALLIL